MTTKLMDMSKEEKIEYLQNVDLASTDFEVKITDFGLSKLIPAKSSKMT